MANTPQLGVNSFLWRATLDTLNFMPLSSADPIGGVVISDWYAPPERPDEHMKVTVYILDRRLRADAVRVAVFRQIRGANGWADAQTNPDTGIRSGERDPFAGARTPTRLHRAVIPLRVSKISRVRLADARGKCAI